MNGPLTLVVSELERVLLVGDDLVQLDDVRMVELAQDLDLAHGSDGEPFLLVLQPDLLQRHQAPCHHRRRTQGVIA